jgi:hypothetical protein
MLKRLTCSLIGHRRVTTRTLHPVAKDVIADRTDCSRCHKTLRSWPPPLGAPGLASEFADPVRLAPIGDLDQSAWSIMRARQEHLPIGHVRNSADRESLRIVESRAANKIAKRFGFDELHTFSLQVHHCNEVEKRVADQLPTDSHDWEPTGSLRAGSVATYRRFARRPRALNFTVGWGTWFRNRQVGIRWRLFRLRTLNFSHRMVSQ